MANTSYRNTLNKIARAIGYLSVLLIGGTVIISAAITPAESQEPASPGKSLQPLFDAPEAGVVRQAPKPNMDGFDSSVEAPSSTPWQSSSEQPLPTSALPPMQDVPPSSPTQLPGESLIANQPTNQVRMVSTDSRTDLGQATTADWSAPSMVANTPANSPATPTLSGSERIHTLTRTTWESFEERLLNTWQSRLKVATTEDGRHARVLVPNRKNTAYLPILIDRQTNLLTFEGSEAQQESWQSLVRNLDNSPSDGRIVLIDMKDIDQSQVVQTAYMMGFQDQTPAAQPPQDQPTQPQDPNQTPDQGDDVVRGVRMPGQGGARQRPILLTQDDIPGVQGPVRIEVVPELGIIILRGKDSDVAKVEAMINDIVRTSGLSEATQQQIMLENAQSSQVAERLQELYDNNYAESKGAASIAAWDTPNSLIIIGQPDSIRVIEDLVKLVDVKQPPGTETKTEFKIYRLRYISANDAKIRVDQLLGQSNIQANTENQPPALPARSTADFRSNTLSVWANKAILAQVDELIKALDVDKLEGDEGAVNVVKVVPLRNSLASEIQPIIQDTLNGQLQNAGTGLNNNPQGQAGGQNLNQQTFNQDGTGSSLRAAMLELQDEFGERIRSAITFDIRVTADTNSNSLIITGPESAMPFVEALIKRLDRIPDAETIIKVFPIHHGDAASLLEMLNTLFTGQNQNQQQGGGGLNQGQLPDLPLQQATAADGVTLANIRFSLDERTNTIIVSGTASDIAVIDSLITRLDVDNYDNRLNKVYRLSNLQAQDVADAINAWLDERQQIIADDPTLVSPIAQVRRQVSVTPVAVGNSLIVSAIPEYFDEIAAIIHELDRRPNTVKVKVLIAEIDLSTLEEIGVDIGVQNSLLFDRGAADGINFAFNQAGIGNDAVGRGTFAGQALSNLGVGRQNGTLGYGGLVLSAGNESVSVLLRALDDKRCLRVLSKPHMMTIENLQGRIFSGASVPRIVGTSQNNFNNGIQNDVVDEDVGLILGITPRVSPDGTIVMFIDAQRSALGDEADGIAVAVSATGEVIRSPQINRTQIQTTVQARHGQTVVISGLVQEGKTHFSRGAPIIKDLPVIGPLFRFEGDAADRSELLVILTPYLVNSDEEIQFQNQDEMDRVHWCESDVAEVYGNTEYGRSANSEPDVYYPDMDPTGMQPQVGEPANASPIQPGFEQEVPQR